MVSRKSYYYALRALHLRYLDGHFCNMLHNITIKVPHGKATKDHARQSGSISPRIGAIAVN